MNNGYANFLNETEKLFLKRKTKIFLFFSALIPVVLALLFSLLQSKVGIQTSGFSLFILGIFTSLFLPLFTFSCAGDLFAGEVANKTLKLTLTRPISRFKIYLSKNLALLFFVFAFLMIVLASALLSQTLILGNANVNELLQIFKAYLVSVVPMLSIGLMAVLIALLFSSSSGALMVCFVVFIIGKTLPFLSPVFAKIIPFSYTDWYILWLGGSVGIKQLAISFTLLLSYVIIFFSIGFYLFDKKEL